MDKKVFEAMNEQIKHELYSAYFYLSMSAWAETENLPGAAAWLRRLAAIPGQGRAGTRDEVL